MPTNHDRPPIRQGRTIDELALLLEDALSAAAGWTVPPPTIQPVEAPSGGANWTVDTRQMDEGMRAAVRNLQARYEIADNRPPARRRFSLSSAMAWRRGRHLLI